MIGNNYIPGPRGGEEIVLHLRRHPFIFFKIFLFIFVLCLAPAIIYFFISRDYPDVLSGDYGRPITLVLLFSYYLAMLLFFFTSWTETYLDVWTVTTERIINREQVGLFNRVVSELDLYRIQDITAEQKGFFPTIFHYGDVHIQTAGTQERFVFEQIPNPYKIAKIIQQLDEKAKASHHVNQ